MASIAYLVACNRIMPCHWHDGTHTLTNSLPHFLTLFHTPTPTPNSSFFRSPKVIVAETAPSFTGQEMAVRLSDSNVTTTLITDAAVFAMMARVNKVVIPTHAVMANGGLLVQAGGHAVALAAKHHAVPVVCVTGLYKLCPLYPHDQDTFNDLQSPSPILRYRYTLMISLDLVTRNVPTRVLRIWQDWTMPLSADELCAHLNTLTF